MKNKEIEELLNELKEYASGGLSDLYPSEDTVKEFVSYIEQLENNRDKTINYIDITIELIEQQPTQDDTWILDRLKGFKFILKGDSDE